MKKLFLAVLLVLPLAAQAAFVDDCKSASVEGDFAAKVWRKAGLEFDYNKAEQEYSAKCACVDAEVSSLTYESDEQRNYTEEVFLTALQYGDRYTGVSAKTKIYVSKTIQQCITKTDKVKKDKIVGELMSKRDSCVYEFIGKSDADPQDKKDAVKDYKTIAKVNGNWANMVSDASQTLVRDAGNFCY